MLTVSATSVRMALQGKRRDDANGTAWRAPAPVPSPPGRRPRLLSHFASCARTRLVAVARSPRTSPPAQSSDFSSVRPDSGRDWQPARPPVEGARGAAWRARPRPDRTATRRPDWRRRSRPTGRRFPLHGEIPGMPNWKRCDRLATGPSGPADVPPRQPAPGRVEGQPAHTVSPGRNRPSRRP